MRAAIGAGLIASSAASLPPFSLFQPRSVDEAVACLAAEGSVVMAGGTDLVARYNEGLAPGRLVDVSGVEELRGVEMHGSLLRIGAGVTHGVGSANTVVRGSAPGFADAWARIANPRVRLRATLGGNLMARRQRYEASLLLTALQARLCFATSVGTRTCHASALWHDELPAAALLVAVEIDTGPLLAFDYERSLRPLMTQAVALFLQPDGLRLSFAIGSEFLPPTHIALPLSGVMPQALAAQAREIAGQVLSHLPMTFADPIVSAAYARRAGAALLARQLENLDV